MKNNNKNRFEFNPNNSQIRLNPDTTFSMSNINTANEVKITNTGDNTVTLIPPFVSEKVILEKGESVIINQTK